MNHPINKEIIIFEKPKIPTQWSYNQSVKKVKVLVYKWKNLTAEVVNELFIAREILNNPGARTDLKEKKTWENYCEEIGIEKRTANRWIERTLDLGTFVPRSETPELPEGKYNIIYADPPWTYSNTGFEMSANKHYLTMLTEEICKLQIPSADNAVLFLWATNPQLLDAIQVMNVWEFSYKTNLVWIKKKNTAGFYIFGQHELLLIGVKGEKMLPIGEKFKSLIITDENKIHSKKPEIVYEMIEKMYPNQKYLELFARNTSEKWTSWGNEI